MQNGDLADKFLVALLDLYRNTVQQVKGYKPKGFLDMIAMQGGVIAAREVITATNWPDGFTRLYEAGRLDLTVEAFLLEHPEFHSLFSSAELQQAAGRLAQANYNPKTHTDA